MDTPSRCIHVTVSVIIETPMNAASATAISCPICMTRRRSSLSATAPPNSASDSIGTANPAFTSPRTNGDAVISYAR